VSGSTVTYQSGAGTGDSAASEQIFKTPVAHGSDGVQQTQVTRLTLSSAGNNLQNADLQKDGEPVPFVLSTVAAINMKAVAATTLYTVPAGKTVLVWGCTLQVTAANAANGDSEAGVGIAAGESDIVASQVLTAFGTNGLDDAYSLSPLGGLFRVADGGEAIKLGVDVADTGTALTATARLWGIEF
jgi:hypothetical protein